MLSCRILILLKHFTSKLPAKIQYLPIIINVLPKISFKISKLASVFFFCVYELTEFIELASALVLWSVEKIRLIRVIRRPINS